MAYYEDIVLTPSTEVKCTLCDYNIQDKDNIIEAHMDTKQHKKLYLNRLMNQNSISIKKFKLFCNLCKNVVETACLIKHVHTIEHQNNFEFITKLIEKDSFLNLPNKETAVQCILCDLEIDFTLVSIKNHITSSRHIRAKSIALQPLNGIFSVEGDDYLWCKICQIYFDNLIEVILDHVENAEHAIQMKNLRELCGEDIDIVCYLQNQRHDKGFCKKCGIEVPCNVDNIERHVKGKKHSS